jgi:hypothetical protein
MIVKPQLLIVVGILFAITLILLVSSFVRSCSQSTGEIKQEKASIKNDKVQIIKLAPMDSFWMKRARLWEDSANYHKKIAKRYTAPITVTKAEIASVFQADSTTITKEVKKGIICDSLQRSQYWLINSLEYANVSLDSAISVKNETIKYSLKMDSTHLLIEKALKRKIINRTVGEIALGLLVILVTLFHP